jgi:hypothetical protein
LTFYSCFFLRSIHFGTFWSGQVFFFTIAASSSSPPIFLSSTGVCLRFSRLSSGSLRFGQRE